MGLGGIAPWTPVLWAAILLLAVVLVWALEPHPRAAGGVILAVVAVMAISTPGTWGSRAPWVRLDSLAGSSATSLWWIPRPPWIVAPLPGSATIRLRAVDFAFQPSVVAAPPGVPLDLEIINSGVLEHIVVIPALGIRASVLPGQRRTVRVGRVEAGTYEFFCAIPAHRAAGMVGSLVVGPED